MKRFLFIIIAVLFPVFASAQLTKGKYKIRMFDLRSTDGTEIATSITEGSGSFIRVTETLIIFYFDTYPALTLMYSDKPKRTENNKIVYECYNTETDNPVLFHYEKVEKTDNLYTITLMKSNNRIEIFGISKIEK